MKEFFKKINYKRLLARIGIVTGITVLFLLIALFTVLCIINYGPSKRAHKVFVKSVRETFTFRRRLPISRKALRSPRRSFSIWRTARRSL